jgi:hypothetical protein
MIGSLIIQSTNLKQVEVSVGAFDAVTVISLKNILFEMGVATMPVETMQLRVNGGSYLSEPLRTLSAYALKSGDIVEVRRRQHGPPSHSECKWETYIEQILGKDWKFTVKFQAVSGQKVFLSDVKIMILKLEATVDSTHLENLRLRWIKDTQDTLPDPDSWRRYTKVEPVDIEVEEEGDYILHAKPKIPISEPGPYCILLMNGASLIPQYLLEAPLGDFCGEIIREDFVFYVEH